MLRQALHDELDELAIGFSAGLLRLPIPALVIAVSAQAFVVTQLGLRLGGRLGRGLPRESLEDCDSEDGAV